MSERRPPARLEAWLEKRLPSGPRGEAILGDLAEEFAARAERGRGARLWYWRVSLELAFRFRHRRRSSRPTSTRRGEHVMSSFWSDWVHALRAMWLRPGFSAIVVATLALGIGANAAIFSIVDALVLRPFPVPEIDRLVMLYELAPDSTWDRHGVAPANLEDWQSQSREIERFVAYEWWDVNLTGGERPERIQGTRASPGFLALLGVEPALGRTLADARVTDGTRSAVLSHALWSRRFAADENVLGSTVVLNGEPHTVVGVAEAGFDYPVGTDVWAPLFFDAETEAVRDNHYLSVVGRLRDGASVEDARAELDVIAERLAERYPNTNAGRGINTMAMERAVVDIGAPAFLYLWQATSVFVLLIACANVANLLLARGADRRKELSLQLALGASRARIVRRLLVENVVLSLTGAVIALPFAAFGVDLLRGSLPPHIRRFVVGWDQIDVDLRLLAFTALVAVAAAIVFGLAPALSASRTDLNQALREDGRGSGTSRGRRLGRNALVSLEVALALALLVASGLSIRGTLRMANEYQGFEPDGVMTMQLVLPESRYGTDEARLQFYRDVLTGVRALPGVVSADFANILPSSGNGWSKGVEIEGEPVENASERPQAHYRVASHSFFETMRIPILEGRGFLPSDREDAQPVVVVSEGFAERHWPGQEAVGKRFRFDDDDGSPWWTVVGVSGSVIHDWFLGGARPTFYVPLAQQAPASVFFAVRTGGSPEAVTAAVRDQIVRRDPEQPVFNAQTMRVKISERTIGLKYAASIMALFGAIALALAAVGIYGVMAYSVSRRTHEIGLRIALGAGRNDVLGLTLGHALRVTSVGLALGLVLAYLAGRVMANVLYGVVELEASTYVGIALMLAAVAIIAGYVPARRAMAIEPSTALRVD